MLEWKLDHVRKGAPSRHHNYWAIVDSFSWYIHHACTDRLTIRTVLRHHTCTDKLPIKTVLRHHACTDKLPIRTVLRHHACTDKLPIRTVLRHHTCTDKLPIRTVLRHHACTDKLPIRTVLRHHACTDKLPIRTVLRAIFEGLLNITQKARYIWQDGLFLRVSFWFYHRGISGWKSFYFCWYGSHTMISTVFSG